MLARREHSRHELAVKLMAKGFSEGIVQDLVMQLGLENLVSDERFVEAMLHSRIQRGYGPARIAQELRQKGVDEELVERRVDFFSRQWLERVREVWRKKYGDTLPDEPRERAKQMRFLQSRGFTVEQILHVMHGRKRD